MRCVITTEAGERCLQPARRGSQVCRTHFEMGLRAGLPVEVVDRPAPWQPPPEPGQPYRRGYVKRALAGFSVRLRQQAEAAVAEPAGSAAPPTSTPASAPAPRPPTSPPAAAPPQANDRWPGPDAAARRPRCDGCGQPITSQAEHDRVCGWSAVAGRNSLAAPPAWSDPRAASPWR